MRYLVIGSGWPGFASPEEAGVVLEDIVLPGHDMFTGLEKEKKIKAGGLPLGERLCLLLQRLNK